MALVKCVALCMDAKWRLNSAGVPMHALIGIWQRCKAKAGEAANPTTDCTFEAGHFHHDASLLAMVLSVPPSAEVRRQRQSVFMEGAKVQMLRMVLSAQASAAAAVLHQWGGVPFPKPMREPLRATTTTPKPVDLDGFHLP